MRNNGLLGSAVQGEISDEKVRYTLPPLPRRERLKKLEGMYVGCRHVGEDTSLKNFEKRLRKAKRGLRNEGAAEFRVTGRRVFGYRTETDGEWRARFVKKFKEAFQHRANVYAARELKEAHKKEAGSFPDKW